MAPKTTYKVNIPSDLKYLILHESPWEVKTVSSFLPKGYMAMATIWHFLKTSEKELDIDTDNWIQNLKLDSSKKDVISNIQKAIDQVKKNNGKVILASDPDREWACIWKSIVDYFKLKKGVDYVAHANPVSLVEKEYMQGVLNPKDDYDINLAESWLARQMLDKFIWFRVTEHLWWISASKHAPFLHSIETKLKEKVTSFENINKDLVENNNSIKKTLTKFKELNFWPLENFQNRTGISFWRVQIASLILLVQKELEVLDKELERKVAITAKDKKELVWDYSLNTELETNVFKMKEIFSKLDIKNIKEAIITNVSEKTSSVTPPSTMWTTLAQTGLWNQFGYSVKTIMTILQSLYEKWLTTYMRTDTNATSKAYEEYIEEMLNWINNKFVYRKYGLKNAQEGHFWILPTRNYDLNNLSKYTKDLSKDESKVFEYVVRRSVAAFMEEAKIKNTTYTLSITFNDNTKEDFILKKNNIIDEGFLKIYNYNRDKYESSISYNKDDNIDIKEFIFREKDIKLPWSYTETWFVKEMENHGIWRPSTVKDLIDVLKKKWYIDIKDKKLEVTPKWYWVYETVTKEKDLFGEFKELEYTAYMESQLDLIAKWSLNKKVFLDIIKEDVQKLSGVQVTSEDLWKPKKDVNIDVKSDLGECKSCKKWRIEHKEVNGKEVWSCSNWKECKLSIWWTIAWHQVTEDEVKYMLENLESPVIEDFKSKAWKNFKAKLVFNKKKGFEFEFVN